MTDYTKYGTCIDFPSSFQSIRRNLHLPTCTLSPKITKCVVKGESIKIMVFFLIEHNMQCIIILTKCFLCSVHHPIARRAGESVLQENCSSFFNCSSGFPSMWYAKNFEDEAIACYHLVSFQWKAIVCYKFHLTYGIKVSVQ